MNELTSSSVPARRRMGPAPAFALAAGVIGLCLAASAAPSPLYKLYQAKWHFSTPTLTLVYATYCFGVLASLLLFGRISDTWGRRPMITIGLVGLLASMVVFMLAPSLPWLFFARGLQGASTGIAISAAGAALLELHRGSNPAKAGLLNAVASASGVGLGALMGAALAQYAPHPLVIPFAVLAGLIVLLLAGALAMPETVARKSRRGFRISRPGVPGQILAPFVLSALGITISWAIVGLYLALVPALAPALLNSKSHLAAGSAIFALGVTAALAPWALQRLAPAVQIAYGTVSLSAGVGLMAISLNSHVATLFITASLVMGAGIGLSMVGALRVLGAAAPPNNRAQVMAAFYIVAYAAISIPAIAAGFAVRSIGAVDAFQVFGGAIVPVCLGTLGLAVARWRGETRAAAAPARLRRPSVSLRE